MPLLSVPKAILLLTCRFAHGTHWGAVPQID